MSDDTYNGYTNYETWCVCLWIDNEEASQNYWAERAREIAQEVRKEDDHETAKDAAHAAVHRLETEVQDGHEQAASDLTVPGAFGDLLQHALGRVNWYEVAETRFDDDETFIEA